MLENMFGANVNAGLGIANQVAVKSTNRNVTIDTPPTTTTDNNTILARKNGDNELSHSFAQDENVRELPYKFRSALGEQINQQKTQKNQKNQNKIKIGQKISNFNDVSCANQAQIISAQETITSPVAIAANINNQVQHRIESESYAETNQSDNVSETLQLSVPFAQTPNPGVGQVTSAKSGKTVSVTTGQMVSAVSQTENKSGQIITEQNQVNSRFGLTNASVAEFAADTDQPQGKTILSVNGDGNQHSGTELITEEVAAGGATATTGEKPPVTNIPIVPDGPKKPLLNDKLSETDSKLSDTIVGKPNNSNSDTEALQAGQILSQFSDADNNQPRQPQANPSAHAALKDSNPTQVQISGSQTKGSGNSTSENNSDSDAGHFNWMISSDDLQPPTTEQTSFSNQQANTSSYLSSGVGEQIRESVKTSLSQGDQQITIRLNPPELGKVFIKFQQHDGSITGILEVSRQQTRYEVEQALPEVIRNLADSGIGITKLEVVTTNTEHFQHQAGKDQSLSSGQNSWFSQNSSADSDAQPENSDTNETNQWFANTYENTEFTELQSMVVTGESINMLV